MESRLIKHRGWIRYGYVLVVPFVLTRISHWEDWSGQTDYLVMLLMTVGMTAVLVVTEPEFRRKRVP